MKFLGSYPAIRWLGLFRGRHTDLGQMLAWELGRHRDVSAEPIIGCKTLLQLGPAPIGLVIPDVSGCLVSGYVTDAWSEVDPTTTGRQVAKRWRRPRRYQSATGLWSAIAGYRRYMHRQGETITHAEVVLDRSRLFCGAVVRTDCIGLYDQELAAAGVRVVATVRPDGRIRLVR
ncbi:MAG: hypothetical protein HQL66_03345 [Magnetococcales bacterium]|nr:hypothetical protein [Magnetococcales bacterium]